MNVTTSLDEQIEVIHGDRTFVYVDNSNLYAGARRISALQRGLPPGVICNPDNVQDHSYRLNMLALREVISRTERVENVVVYGSETDGNSPYWHRLHCEGFEVGTVLRAAGASERGVDVALAIRMVRDACLYLQPTTDRIMLVSGDQDFVPVVQMLREYGFHVTITFWSQTSHALRNLASDFRCLDHHLEELEL